VLDCCWGVDQNRCFSGGIDRVVKTYDFGSSTETVLGEHEKGVKAVCWQKELGAVVSGGWDKQIKVWDARAAKCTASSEVPDKVFTMAVTSNRIVVGTANRHVWVYDVRNLKEPEQKRESSLKFQTRCIRAYPDGSGYALSSIEGRVAMEYFDPAPEFQSRSPPPPAARRHGADPVLLSFGGCPSSSSPRGVPIIQLRSVSII